MGIDYQVVFPSGMLLLGMHPMHDVEYHVSNAFNRWIIERIIPDEPRLLCLLYLPFQSPELCVQLVEKYAHIPGVIGFTVSGVRNNPVYHPPYMKLYRAIEATGKPLVFHTAYNWTDPSFAQLNRFGAMHALSFSHYCLIHLTNWLFNGLPDRFPNLKLMWVEGGLAWIPYLMQRLDHEVLMRPSEAPGLKRLPSEYIREMYFTSQPLERSNMKMLQATMETINAETQLLFASDWPHWDFDPPSAITTLPFLNDTGQAQHPRPQRGKAVQSAGQARAAACRGRAGVARQPGELSRCLTQADDRPGSVGDVVRRRGAAGARER